jgi:copper(I)-binding protein
MKRVFAAMTFACGLLYAGAASAQVSLKVDAPWVRATVSTQAVTGAFMQLTASKDARLVEAQSPVAGLVEIHQMEMDGNVMKMHAVAGIDLPAGKAVALRPGSYHLMLMQLKRQIRPGETVPVTLIVEAKDKSRTTMTVNVPVRAMNE